MKISIKQLHANQIRQGSCFNFPRNNFNNDIDKSVEGVLHFNYNKTTQTQRNMIAISLLIPH